MAWQKKKKIRGKHQHYSLSRKLKRENRITDNFEVMLNTLSLEELIGLKLELANRAAGFAVYGLPLYYSIRDIARIGLLMYAASATRSVNEAARFLGISRDDFREAMQDFEIKTYFEEERQKK